MHLTTKRILFGATAVSLLLVGAHSPAVAAKCGDRENALGVSRTIIIDTKGGKLYGGLQYHANKLLKDGEVVLTFDDGPLRRYTRKVLAALKSHCTKATFFMVGRMAVSDPAMVREVEQAGHTVAHHTWSHKNLQRRSARRAGGEIELGVSAVQAAAAKPTAPFFRFPYLADPNTMIAYGRSRNLGIFSIDIDSYDYKTKSPDRVHSNIMSQLRSRRKGIILFHDIQFSTAHAIQRVLDTIQKEGFKIVHLKPASAIETLPDYDAQAQALHEKHRTAASAAPIGGGDYEKATRAKRRPLQKATSKAKAAGPKVAAVSAPAQPEVRVNPFPGRSSAARAEPDWRRKVWGN